MPTRTAAARRRRRGKPRRRRFGAGVWLRLPILEQRDFDLIGLALVALGAFLACVLYLGWSGGEVGAVLTAGFAYMFGALVYAAPVALAVAGGLVIMRPLFRSGRPLGAGGACLLCALTLGFAAGTLGLGPGGARPGTWETGFVQQHGGVVGEALYTVADRAVQPLGAHILAVFLFAAGVLLVTGATLAGVVDAARGGLTGAGRRLRSSTAELGAALRRDRVRAAEPPPAGPVSPPEPSGPDLVVRATHVEAPSLDRPELFDFARESGCDAPDDGPPTGDAEADADESASGSTTLSPAASPTGAELTPQGRYRASVVEDPDFEWRLPDPSFLKRSRGDAARPDTSNQEAVAAQLLEALGHFGVHAKVVGTVTGPHITRYKLRLAPGTKVAKVAQLKDDLAYALAATEIRILAPIPGEQAVGVEVPNQRRRIVHLGDVFQEPPADWSPLTVWLGKDVAGRAIGADLVNLAHVLVAGTTGSGKSGCINAMLSSILLRATPSQVRMVLVDPKQVELSHYDSIPHLLTPVITNPRMAANALANLVREMEQRYGIMSLARTRNLGELNRARAKRGEPPLPYVLCVIDELADLMMVAPADVEDAVIRLAQKARAVGIHLVLATQSPRVDVITGMIKANVPSRIAFAVSSQTDSRVILDQNGAESLLGQGDMLFSPIGSSRLQRILGAYIDEAQIAVLTQAWRGQGEPEFREELLEEVVEEDSDAGGDEDFHPDEDPLLEDAIALVAQMGTASTSMLQRRLRLGYTRAGRLIDMLERRGVISGYEGSKPRQVLIGEADIPRIIGQLGDRDTGAPEPSADDGPVEIDSA
ncbi:MAG TPA: DNA translocase FtsK [Solirubrobacteraceae bacterium]|nr:DNA translocase FtsK [Solirubrobacteraceae bacterium]